MSLNSTELKQRNYGEQTSRNLPRYASSNLRRNFIIITPLITNAMIRTDYVILLLAAIYLLLLSE